LITNGMERNELYGFTVHHVARPDYDPYAERPPFLVDGILHHTVTLLYGEAKIGKSTLAAALTDAPLTIGAGSATASHSPIRYAPPSGPGLRSSPERGWPPRGWPPGG